jgi:cation diffusion facilitator CzcD-associated flavoprotein CzcO
MDMTDAARAGRVDPAQPREDPMRTHAQAVVIGGGVVGCSILYHLAKAGWTEVVLLERSN